MVKVIRLYSSDQGTQGVLYIKDTPFCLTLELPWNDNIKKFSCIPIGYYKCVPWRFHGIRKAFHLLNVPHRNSVLIHSGNFAGDVRKGYKSNVEGCILVGSKIGYLGNQLAVLCSRPTLHKLVNILEWNPFYLFIDDVNRDKYDSWLEWFDKSKKEVLNV